MLFDAEQERKHQTGLKENTSGMKHNANCCSYYFASAGNEEASFAEASIKLTDCK